MLSWFSRRQEPDPLVLQLIEMMRSQAESQAKLMEKMLEQSAVQAAQSQELMQEIMGLWKPTRDPVATTMDERIQARESGAEWEPIPFNVFEQLDADIGVPEEFLT